MQQSTFDKLFARYIHLDNSINGCIKVMLMETKINLSRI